MHIKTAILFLVFIFSASSAKALRFAYIDVPPYAYQNSEGYPSGLLIERVRQISQSIQEPITFVYLPHRRLIPFIESGEVDFWAGQKKSNVDDVLSLVSNSPVFMMDMQAFWLAGHAPVSSVESLHGKSLILISSYGYQGNLQALTDNAKDVVFVTSHEDGIDALYDNPNHYLLGYKKIGNTVLTRFDISNIESATLLQSPLYLKLSSKLKNAAAIMHAIDLQISAQQ